MMLAERILGAAGGTVRHVAVASELVSTQETAGALLDQILAEEIALDTTLIVARSQSGGRGRSGREWISPAGGLYLTWVRSCREGVTPEAIPLLAAAAAVLSADTVAPGVLTLKWPNDLMIGAAKAGGVLVTARRGDRPWVAVGLGINLLAAPPLPDGGSSPAASLGDHVPGLDWEEAAVTIAVAFARGLDGLLDDPARGVALWRERLVHAEGDPMAVRLADGTVLEGRCAGLTAEGFLRLATESGERTVAAGDVVHWR